MTLEFSERDTSSKRNGLFTNRGLRGMSEGKDYCTLNLSFPIVSIFNSKATGLIQEAPIRKGHKIYSYLIRC